MWVCVWVFVWFVFVFLLLFVVVVVVFWRGGGGGCSLCVGYLLCFCVCLFVCFFSYLQPCNGQTKSTFMEKDTQKGTMLQVMLLQDRAQCYHQMQC